MKLIRNLYILINEAYTRHSIKEGIKFKFQNIIEYNFSQSIKAKTTLTHL